MENVSEVRDQAAFDRLFSRWAQGVRLRMATRTLATGMALGLALAVLPALLAWHTRHGSLRTVSAALGVVGALVGLVLATRRRWSDGDVALWLDDRLDTREVISTAVDRRGRDDSARADDTVLASATAALRSARPEQARPALFRPLQLLAPLGIVALVWIARAPLPAAPPVVVAPGEARVQITQVEGLKKIAQLGQAHARDEAQRQRLDQIARDADKLRLDLDKGMEKREALDRIAKLRDAIAAEKLSLGDGEKRTGLEAAISKLEQNDSTKEAARALGDHDLERMDREMERLANSREKADRDSAKHALEDAAAAARKSGAPDVGKALDEEKKAFEEREKRSEALRDLEKAMEDSGLASPDQKSEAEALDRKGSDEAARKLADSMGKALEKLTPEERKRLAEKLKKAMKQGATQSDPQTSKDLADALSNPQGQQSLEDELKAMANEDDESPESKGQQQLDGAQDGADGTEGQLNGQSPGDGSGPGQGKGKGPPVPVPMPGQGGSQDANGDGAGQAGHHHDTGTGPHNGHTGEVDTGTLRSRAHGPVSRAPGMPGAATGWTPGKADGTANVRGTGALGTVAPQELDGVDHSDVPQEYREQVRQYFQP